MRFLGNRSSGKQGYAIARLAVQRGAEATLVSGYTAGPRRPGRRRHVHVRTAEDMRVAVAKHAPGFDAVIMAAAVADFRPSTMVASKIKKSGASPTRSHSPRTRTSSPGWCSPGGTARSRPKTVFVGFAAETGDADGDVLTYATGQARAKGLRPPRRQRGRRGQGVRGRPQLRRLLGADGSESALEHGSKALMASRELDAVDQLFRTLLRHIRTEFR